MQNFLYEKKAFNIDKTFTVHQLSSQGVDQFLSKDSYLRSYLPAHKKIFHEGTNKKEAQDINYKQYKSEEKHMKNRNFDSMVSRIPDKQERQSRFEDLTMLNQSNVKEVSESKNQDTELINKIISFFDKKKKVSKIKLNKNESKLKQDFTLIQPINYNTRINFSKLTTDNNKSPQKFQKTFEFSPKGNQLLEKEKRSTNKVKTNLEFLEKNEECRLTYYKIPHIKNLKKSYSEKECRGLQHSNNLFKTIQMWKNNDSHQKNTVKNNLDHLCIEENEKIKKIISNQVNSDFLSQSKLPKISVLLNHPATVIYKNNIPNSKILSEKYNPYANAPNPSKFYSKRNPFGAIFNN